MTRRRISIWSKCIYNVFDFIINENFSDFSFLIMPKYRPILDSDFTDTDEVFSAQSYRYILYGMSHKTNLSQYVRSMSEYEGADKQLQLNKALIAQLKARLPSHRGLIDTMLNKH